MPLDLFGMDAGPSFVDLLSRQGYEPLGRPSAQVSGPLPSSHATTVLALRYESGVVMAGDRRATEGPHIAHRAMEKLLPADRYSGVAIAGAAGQAMEMVRLFQTQLEHYEKVEGSPLSLEGKANQLAQMVRSNFPLAMQGLVVVPLFAGFDLRRREGRIFSYDAVGGRYEERDIAATGSGGRDARSSLKARFRPGLDEAEASRMAVEALFEAADEDSATGGPDPLRGIYPVVAVIDGGGYRRLGDSEVAELFSEVMRERQERGMSQ